MLGSAYFIQRLRPCHPLTDLSSHIGVLRPPRSQKQDLVTCGAMQWQEIAAEASERQDLARSGHCSAVLPASHEADIIVFGGYTENKDMQRAASNDAFLFHHGAWHPVKYKGKDVPRARLVTQAAITDNDLYVVGGWDPGSRGDGGDILSDVWRLDLTDYSWTQVHMEEPVLQPLSRHQMFAVGKTIYIHNHRCLEYLLTLDVSTTPAKLSSVALSCEGGRPSSRGLHTMTLVGTKAYLFGGASKRGGMLGDLWQLDVEDKTWVRLIPSGTAPHVRCSHSATAISNKIYFFGGSYYKDEGGLQPLDDLFIFDIETCSWQWPDMDAVGLPAPRNAHIAANLNGHLLVSGGWDPFKLTYNDTFLLKQG